MFMDIRYFNGFPVIFSGTKILSDFSQIEFSKLTKSGNYTVGTPGLLQKK